jgi:thymidylate synthase
MKAYLDIVNTVLNEGVLKTNRTGIDTISYFSLNFRHDLADGFPLLTTKKMDGRIWQSIVSELLWFLSGENHIRSLKNKTAIWDAWADENGDLETAYGFYWKNFPFSFDGKMVVSNDTTNERADFDYGVGNFDQVAWIVEQLKTNPNSRRLVCSAWEPYNAHKSKLPPCHFAWIVNVQNGHLCLQWIQRSCDIFLGIPFNIASYSLLCHILAKEAGLKPGVVAGTFIDAHIYTASEDDATPIKIDSAGNTAPRCEFDHVRQLRKQLERKPYSLPCIKITDKPMSELELEDFELLNYQSHGSLRSRVAI